MEISTTWFVAQAGLADLLADINLKVLVHPDTGISVESWNAHASKQEILDHFGNWESTCVFQSTASVKGSTNMPQSLTETRRAHSR